MTLARGRIPDTMDARLVPSLIVILLAIIGPLTSPENPCRSTDGPQFKCWLRHER